MTSVCRRNSLEVLAPIKITEAVFSYLTPQDITCRIALVCQDFARYSANEEIWQRRAVRQIGKEVAGEWFALLKRSWKKTCFIRIETYPHIVEEGFFKEIRKTEKITTRIALGKVRIQTVLKIELKLNGPGLRTNYLNGVTEQGSFREGVLTLGIMTYPNGILHKGSFLSGQLHGSGKKIFKGKTVEKGQFQRGWLHGKGLRVLSNGKTETGNFKNGWLHGRGMILWPNGTKEKGIFSNGYLTTAERQIILPDGRIIEAAIWVNGVLHGSGKVTYPNGTIANVNFHYCSVIA